jgi:hypothetical protein
MKAAVVEITKKTALWQQIPWLSQNHYTLNDRLQLPFQLYSLLPNIKSDSCQALGPSSVLTTGTRARKEKRRKKSPSTYDPGPNRTGNFPLPFFIWHNEMEMQTIRH